MPRNLLFELLLKGILFPLFWVPIWMEQYIPSKNNRIYIIYLARRNTHVQSTIIGMHGRDVQVRFNVAISSNKLSDLKPFAACQFLAVQKPRNVGSGVAGCDTFQTEGWAGAESLFAEAVTDQWWFD